MEFAVYMPEQEPHVGQVLHSYSRSFSSVILPALNSPTASEMEEKLVFAPSTWPASIGPPLTNTVGTLRRAAAHQKARHVLVAVRHHDERIKAVCNAMASVESAMRSRVTSEYFMPVWPIAMPSHTAIAGKTIGVPPAIATPIFTASTILIDIHVARDDLVIGADDADERTFDLLLREAQSMVQRTVRRVLRTDFRESLFILFPRSVKFWLWRGVPHGKTRRV